MADIVHVDRVEVVGPYLLPADLPVQVAQVIASTAGSTSPDTHVNAARVVGVYLNHPYVPPIDYTDNVIVDREDTAAVGYTVPVGDVAAVRVVGVYLDHPYVPPLPDVFDSHVDRVDLIAVTPGVDPDTRVDAARASGIEIVTGTTKVNRVIGSPSVGKTGSDTRLSAVRVVGVYKPGSGQNIALLFGGNERYLWLRR